MDIPKQIQYWANGAKDDLETAKLLIDSDKLLNGLFFCHLSLEKILKAHYVKVFKTIPPKTHNLSWLLEETKINFIPKDQEFLGLMMHYQLEGRYPGYEPDIPDKFQVYEYLYATKSMVEWLMKSL